MITSFNQSMYKSNYIYIKETSRYYYIENITVVKQRMTIECSESDVLTSFKSQLLKCSATLERQSNLFNTYLNDSEYQTYAYNNIQALAFPNSLRQSEQFILVINGGI
ncbi:MAG: hypothetical protein NC200_02645 [Candidatus Gastranaerophilales bacterium]|nr:hypothetical protein [Candidatus Gastranaerophilales bacterium]